MGNALHRFIMAMGLSVFLYGCSHEPSPLLRIGINPWPGYEFIYLAQEKGFYSEEDVSVRIIEFNSLSDARRAFERGQIDGLGTTVIEVLQSRDQSNRSPQIVRVADYSDGADVILAQPQFKHGKDLRGKRIGVELASLGVYVLVRGLAKHGLTLGDVKPVSSDQLSMTAAFQKGELDAIVSYPPESIKLQRDSKANTVFSTAEIPGEVVDVIAIDKELIEKQPQTIKRFLRAFDRATEYALKHPEDAYRIMAAREGITPEEFKQSITYGVKVLMANEQDAYLRMAGKLEPVIDTVNRALRDAGQITGPDRRDGIVRNFYNTDAYRQ